MLLFRLARKKYGLQLSGKGAAIAGGRWNTKGTELIYTAQSRALAVAEVVVHLDAQNLPKDFSMLTIYVPYDSPIQTIVPSQLPRNWNSFPPLKETQSIGDVFIENVEYLLLKVPSAVVKGDYNILINPKHSLYSNARVLEAEDFMLDRRFFF